MTIPSPPHPHPHCLTLPLTTSPTSPHIPSLPNTENLTSHILLPLTEHSIHSGHLPVVGDGDDDDDVTTHVLCDDDGGVTGDSLA